MSKKHLLPNAIRKNIVHLEVIKEFALKHFTETGCGAMKTWSELFYFAV